MARKSPMEFLNEVRSEAYKVTWPTRKETMVTTAMVFVMVIAASLFFVLVDQAIRFLISIVISIGR